MVRFNLKDKKEDITLIRLIYSYGGPSPFKWWTGKKISPKAKYWDYEKQRSKKAWHESEALNDFLNRYASIVTQVHTRCRNEGRVPTKKIFRDALDNQTARPSAFKTESVISFMYAFRDKRKSSGSFSVATILTYDKRISLFENFFKAKRVYSFEEIDLDFMYSLKDWMINEKNYKMSYVKKAVQFLKMIMEESFESGINKNTNFRSKNFTVKQNEVDKIALTWQEVSQLASFEPSTGNHDQDEAMRKMRDRFVVGCNLGQRFSDLFKVDVSGCYEQDGQMLFRFRSQKTITKTVIPISSQVADILEKYGGRLPKISNQKFNDQVKDLFELAGFTEMVRVYEEQKGQVIEKAYPKFKLISSHTMRRTFITNALSEGIPVNIIMDVTGIRNINTLMKYNKSEKDRSALIVSRSKLYQKARRSL
jgi:site-specific recombinase XerD